MKLVLATHNLHKVREMREMLKIVSHLDVLSLLSFPDYRLPNETEKTFLANALLKAEHAAKHLNLWVLADDSGLCVPALGGKPGIHSKRYAGEEATDSENRKKLLQDMKDLTGLERSAYFECCLALADPGGVRKTVAAICEGTVTEKERGRNGFGYDFIFHKHGYEKTFAEIDESTKNRISHRRKAFDKLITSLDALLSSHALPD
ncbi:MAG: RdgB/HAM1 family non-canonical purine NTP pyrophosphatase [Waddliaceae bacterium]